MKSQPVNRDTSLECRLSSLQSRVRTLYAALALTLIGIAAAVAAGCEEVAEKSSALKSIEAQEIRIVDALGNHVATFGANGIGGARLSMLGDGQERFRIETKADRSDLIIFSDGDAPPNVHVISDLQRGGVISVIGKGKSARLPE